MWGDDIKRARDKAGLSLAELSRRTKITRKQLMRAERSENVTMDTIAAIAEHLPTLRALTLRERRVAIGGSDQVDVARAVALAERMARSVAELIEVLTSTRVGRERRPSVTPSKEVEKQTDEALDL